MEKTDDKDEKVLKDPQELKDNEDHWEAGDFRDCVVLTEALVLLVFVENQENKVLLV